MDCAPTVRGEIKKARASNYDLYSALNEFVDNSLDAGSQNIIIDIRERVDDNERWIHKILVSDDSGNGIPELKDIFSWTFERQRQQEEIGEFGTGFKAASVNLAEKLTILTFQKQTGLCLEAIADWHEMSEENVWVPKILTIDSGFMRSYHPFSSGTTLMLENIRHDFIHNQPNMISRVLEELSYSYKYFLKHNPRVEMLLRGTNFPPRPISYSLKNSYMIYYFDHTPLIVESKVLVFRDNKSFDIYLQRDKPYWEKISFVEKRKNGNNILLSTQIAPQRNKVLVDTIIFRSCTYYDESCTFPECFGSVDIVRNHRILAKSVSYRCPRSDPHVYYLKHELIYKNKIVNGLLGIQFNKTSDGKIPDGEMRYTLEYIQKLHEKELIRFEKTKLGRVIVREKTEDDFFCLDETFQSPPSPPPATAPQPTLLPPHPPTKQSIMVLPSLEKQNPPSNVVVVAAATATVKPKASMTITTTPQQDPVVQEASIIDRRKNFTMETKMEAIKKQECRDIEFDFRLRDEILPMDYDHKNGQSHNNSKDNCQLLSVISHALKTRRPADFEQHCENKEKFIVDLLNCITSSKYFVSAFLNGKVKIRNDKSSLTDRNGLFTIG